MSIELELIEEDELLDGFLGFMPHLNLPLDARNIKKGEV